MEPKFVTLEDSVDLMVLGFVHTMRLTGKDTNGTLTLVEVDDAPGHGTPPHIHHNEDETIHILSGSIEFWMNGETFLAGPGTTAFMPRGIPHAFRIVGDSNAHYLLYASPAGIEKMFEELATLPAGPPDIPRVVAICARYGVEMLPM